MFVTTCKDCRFGANQHAAWFNFCDKHWRLVLSACAAKSITPEQLMDDAIEAYVHRYHPDFKRWIA